MKEYRQFWTKGLVFYGTSTRREYWIAIAFHLLFGWMAGMLIGLLGYSFLPDEMKIWSFSYVTLYLVLAIIPQLALMVRRLHDINKSAWYMFLLFVPYVGAVILFVFTFFGSVQLNNRYRMEL